MADGLRRWVLVATTVVVAVTAEVVLGGWVSTVALLAVGVVVVIRGPEWARYYALTVAGAFGAVALVAVAIAATS